jgi:hypothetical protein
MEVLLRTVIGNERGLIKKDYQRWGPLNGMYTGARLNEIARAVQFSSSHRICHGMIWV